MSNSHYARMVSAFMFGMMAGEFPIGWLMDRWGVRFGFSFAVVWWSLATGMHSIGRSVLQFSLFRFWMGTGECGNFSGAMKVISEWFPERERALAVRSSPETCCGPSEGLDGHSRRIERPSLPAPDRFFD